MIDKLPVLVLHVNNRCNCRCTMCSIWKSTDSSELTPRTLLKLLPDIRTLGVENVVFTGGEPLMNAQLPEMCAILKDAGVRVTVLTTGLLLSRFAALLIRQAAEVIVSLDGPREIHDQIRRVAGGYELLTRGVKALRDIDPAFPVTGRCTVQKLNCTSLRQTADAAHAMGLRSISFLAADMASDAFNRVMPLSLIETSSIALSPDDVRALDDEIEALVRDRSSDFASGFIAESPEKLLRIPRHFRAHLGVAESVAPRCNAPWKSAVMETDGSLRPCFFHRPIGNAKAEGLANTLNGPQAVEFRSELRIAEDPVCRRCVCSLYR